MSRNSPWQVATVVQSKVRDCAITDRATDRENRIIQKMVIATDGATDREIRIIQKREIRIIQSKVAYCATDWVVEIGSLRK